ncbi:MAG TPA: DUF4350 domain-containing protein [Pyrinomonadaceae bacterium]|jgi:hypothetical protein|nr:DUF4350 domain-containing protein [Pyrinomonadaceae bacterium]
MRQRLGIIVTIVLAIAVLAAINSAAYITEEQKQDSELNPNRSTYNGGATGTRALHDFLNESGYPVMRWREPPDKLLGTGGDKVRTFVIVGRPRVPIEEEEAQTLLLWVKRGGRLVLIDRHPEDHLLPRSGDWKVTTELLNLAIAADPAQVDQMTGDMKPVQPSQPTLLTKDIESVMPSRFFAGIKFFPVSKDKEKKTEGAAAKAEASNDEDPEEFDEPPPENDKTPEVVTAKGVEFSPAPVVHLATSKAPLLIDYPHGQGRIILLSDPYMVANGGIRLKDNLKLMKNLLAVSEGLVAFDEFHQGHGATHNPFVGYFEGTPVLAIFGQIVFLILLVLWTRGRRFARPLPLAQTDRRSSLEFVASMAELQQRARAYDLAIENIYSRTRRVLARYAGVDYNSPRRVIAERIASRSTIKAHQLDTLMRQAEEAINGGGISERQSIQLVKRLREIETTLGLRMRSREKKQTAQNI